MRQAMKAGNRRLYSPNSLDLTVFQDCPVLGCYMLTCSDTSLVANFFVADPGTCAQDVFGLVAAVRSRVLAETGTELLTEIRFAGEFGEAE